MVYVCMLLLNFLLSKISYLFMGRLIQWLLKPMDVLMLDLALQWALDQASIASNSEGWDISMKGTYAARLENGCMGSFFRRELRRWSFGDVCYKSLVL